MRFLNVANTNEKNKFANKKAGGCLRKIKLAPFLFLWETPVC